jgi:hypothetical protein
MRGLIYSYYDLNLIFDAIHSRTRVALLVDESSEEGIYSDPLCSPSASSEELFGVECRKEAFISGSTDGKQRFISFGIGLIGRVSFLSIVRCQKKPIRRMTTSSWISITKLA